MIEAFVSDSPVFIGGIATAIAAVLGGGLVGLAAWRLSRCMTTDIFRMVPGPGRQASGPGVARWGRAT